MSLDSLLTKLATSKGAEGLPYVPLQALHSDMGTPNANDHPGNPIGEVFLLTLHEIDSEQATLTTLSGKEVTVRFKTNVLSAVVKDLGRWARRNLGLPGRTQPGVFTKIIWKNKALGLNQPLAILLEGEIQQRANRTCTFCRSPLRKKQDKSGPYGSDGPYPFCHFCDDSPTWHHGWCCPQNPLSPTYKGLTHADRTYLAGSRH